jgi:hypothetical protein
MISFRDKRWNNIDKYAFVDVSHNVSNMVFNNIQIKMSYFVRESVSFNIRNNWQNISKTQLESAHNILESL